MRATSQSLRLLDLQLRLVSSLDRLGHYSRPKGAKNKKVKRDLYGREIYLKEPKAGAEDMSRSSYSKPDPDALIRFLMRPNAHHLLRLSLSL